MDSTARVFGHLFNSGSAQNPPCPPSRCSNVGSVGGSIGSQLELLRASHLELGLGLGVPPERIDRLVKLHARTLKMSIRGHMDRRGLLHGPHVAEKIPPADSKHAW